MDASYLDSPTMSEGSFIMVNGSPVVAHQPPSSRDSESVGYLSYSCLQVLTQGAVCELCTSFPCGTRPSIRAQLVEQSHGRQARDPRPTLRRRLWPCVQPARREPLGKLQDVRATGHVPLCIADTQERPVNDDHATFPANHQEATFVNRPFPLEEAHEHFSRLRRWGFTFSA